MCFLFLLLLLVLLFSLSLSLSLSLSFCQSVGTLHYQRQDFEAALKSLSHALGLYKKISKSDCPEMIQVYKTRANVRKDVKDFQGAIDDMGRAVDIASKFYTTEDEQFQSIKVSQQTINSVCEQVCHN